MKKTIMCGSLLVVVILMMLPMVSATEANTIKTTIAQPYRLHIPDIDIESLREGYNNDPSPQTIVLLTLAILLLKLIRLGVMVFVGGIFLIIYRMITRQKNMTAINF